MNTPAMGIDYENRSELFRDSSIILEKLKDLFQQLKLKTMESLRVLNRYPTQAKNHKIPMLITGFSQQSLNGMLKGRWMDVLPRGCTQQKYRIFRMAGIGKKESSDLITIFMQPL